MRWLTVSFLLYLARLNDAGAIKCHPGSQDPVCVTEEKEILPARTLSLRDASKACAPGSEWERDCLRCRCSAEGLAECTRLESCENGGANAAECVPGTTVKIDCNTCHCMSSGRLACTKKGCLTLNFSDRSKRSPSETLYAIYDYNHHSVNKRAVCKPNQEFQVDCNPCKCAANGLSYTCTHNECLEGGDMNKEVEVFMESEGSDHIERHSVCKPEDTFYIGCNTCHCNPYGTDYSCTNKPCPLPEDVEVFHESKEKTTKSSSDPKIVCVANRMFIKDCNTCWCNENGTSYFCTRRVCLNKPDGFDTEDPAEQLKLREIKKECSPNEVFPMDCNMCRCNPDGKSFSCTRRACVDSEKNTALHTLSRKSRGTPEPAKMCQPGQEFRMDCNKCLCNDEGQDFSCTRIDCAALGNNGGVETRRKRDLTEQIEMKCVPGSVFNRECNACRCTEDGEHASCSNKRCQKEKEPEPANTESSPSFRCTPGDQFKRGCKDCTCSADGKNVFCTLRLCDQDLVDKL